MEKLHPRQYDNDDDIKVNKPYFATFKEIPGCMTLHFYGTRDLNRVNRVLDNEEKRRESDHHIKIRRKQRHRNWESIDYGQKKVVQHYKNK